MAPAWSLSDSVEAAFAGEVASPGVINVNFSAGAHPVRSSGGAFWNNLAGSSGEGVPLLDSAGQETTARLSFESATSYGEFNAPRTLNRATNTLYRGGLAGDDTRSEVQVAVSGIPFAAYDVFVFASADTTDESPLSITDGTTTFYYRSAGRNNSRARRLLRTRSERPSAPTPGPAQYQAFTGRIGPEFTLTTGGSRNGILSNNVFGLQIVQAEEGEAMSEGSFRRRGRAAQAEHPRSELAIPFGPGSVIRVRYRPATQDARPTGGAINIYSGPDIALHVNPRPGHGALVLNSHILGAWGPEERPGGYPLHVEGEVCLSVWAGPDGFFIQAVAPGGGEPFCYLYQYRLPEERELGRITVDLPGLRALAVQPEL